LEELKRIIKESDIMDQSDKKWPKPDKIGKQELCVRIGEREITFKTSKISCSAEVQKAEDPEGLNVFFYLVQDLKCFIFSLVNMHFRIKPI
jgi:protein mago nashi